MRKLSLVLALTLATGLPSLSLAVPAHAAPPKPVAELVTKAVSGSLTAGKVSAIGTVKNKGSKSAKASAAAFYLSVDAKHGSDDVRLGSAPVRKIKSKKAAAASGTFAVPATLAAGAYHVVICADASGQVKERKETNNCKGSTGTVTVAAGGGGTPTGPVTVSATAGTGGSVAPSAVTGGSCASLTCTFPTAGTGTVTFTPTPASSYRFDAWTGASCTGYTSGTGGKITFSKPTSNAACTATFVKQVKVSFSQLPSGVLGTIAGAATHGSCTQPDMVLGTGGSCVVDATTGTVTLLATAGVGGALPFKAWTGDCSGTTNPLQLTNLTTDKTCSATFGL
jgi:CARDB protein